MKVSLISSEIFKNIINSDNINDNCRGLALILVLVVVMLPKLNQSEIN